MKKSKDTLERNWPSVLYRLKGSTNVDKYNIKKIKHYYFESNENVKPILQRRKSNEPVSLARLLLAHEIDTQIMDELSAFRNWDVGSINEKNHAEDLAKKVVNNFSGNPYITFGANSYFDGMESKIADALGYFSDNRLGDRAEKIARGISKKQNCASHLNYTAPFSKLFYQPTPAVHNISWNNARFWSLATKCIGNSDYFKPSEFQCIKYCLAADWATKNPDNLDDRVVKMSKIVCEAIQSDETVPSLQDYLGYHVNEASDTYRHFLDRYHPGKKITIAVKYNSRLQLTSMIEQMYPASRFPVTKDDPPGTVHHLPDTDDYDWRASTHIITGLWGRCADFLSHEVVDNSILLCHPRAALMYDGHCFGALGYDATDIGNKVLAKKRLETDLDYTVINRFPNCVVFGENKEDWYITNLGLSLSVRFASSSKLSEHFNHCKTSDDLAVALTSSRGQKLIKSELEVQRLQV